MEWPFLERIEMAQESKLVPESILTKEKFPSLVEYMAKMKERPEIRSTMQPYDVHAEFAKVYFTPNAVFDIGTVEE